MQKLGESDTVSVTVKMPRAMRDALDDTVAAEGHANRSDAARHAIEKGLGGKPPKKRRARAAARNTAREGDCPHPETRRIGTGCGRCGQDPV